MLVGYPPFFAENPSATCKKVLDWRNTFVIPKEARLSREATDLMLRLICDSTQRLGINGVDEIKAHPFFRGVDWGKIRSITAPNIPKLTHAEDTSGFDEFPEIDPWHEEENPQKNSKKHKKNRVNDVHFIGYTYKRSLENQKIQSIANLFEEIDNTREAAEIDKKIEQELRSAEKKRKTTVEKNDMTNKSQNVMKKKTSNPKNNNYIEASSKNLKGYTSNNPEDQKINQEDQQQTSSQRQGTNTANVFREKQLEQEKILHDQLTKEREKQILKLQKDTQIKDMERKRFAEEQRDTEEGAHNNAKKYVSKGVNLNRDLNKSNSPINSKMNTNSQKMMFTSSMLNKEVSYDKNVQQAMNPNNIQYNVNQDKNSQSNRGGIVVSRMNKNGPINVVNAINSTGALKKDQTSMFSSNMRLGGSPVTVERSNVAKSSNQIKMNAGTFFNKDNKKTTKSPRNVDIRRTINSGASKDKAKDNKKAFNMQFNEYMSKQKNMNLNFLHSGKPQVNNNLPQSFYKMG